MKRKSGNRRRRTRRPRRGAGTFTKKVRAVIARQAEIKSRRATTLEEVLTTSSSLVIRGYETGVQNSLTAGAINARIGNEVYTKRMSFRWIFKTTNTTAIALRVVLFKAKTVGNSPGAVLANFYQGDLEADGADGNLRDITRELSKENYTILRDKVYRISPRGEMGSFVYHNWFVRGQGKTKFSEDSDNYPTNKDVYIAFIPRRADNDPAADNAGEVTCTTIHNYTDM